MVEKGHGVKKLVWVVFATAAVAWVVCAWFDVAGQRELFVEKGAIALSDYYMPWKCANEGYVQAGLERYLSPDGRELVMGEFDRCYPAFAMLPHCVLPFSNTGALVFDLAGALVFLLALIAVARRSGSCMGLTTTLHSSLLLLIFPLSMPFIFALDRANTVWFSAAAVAVFLAWWDDEKTWKRYVAAGCLAFAAVLKIAPAVLGVLYFADFEKGTPSFTKVRRHYREILFAPFAFVMMLVVPFAWFGGWDGFIQFLHNAAENGSIMSSRADFGLYPIVRQFKILMGMDWQQGVSVWRLLTQVLGLVCLVRAFFVRDRRDAVLFAIGGMLLVPGNMMYYGALYLIPVFILSRPSSLGLIPLCLWFVILCPFQLVILGHSVNAVLCNCAILALMAERFWYNFHCNERHKGTDV